MNPATELGAQLLAMAQHDTQTGALSELAEAITSEMRFAGVLRQGERVSRQSIEDLVRGRRRQDGELMMPSLVTGLSLAAYLEIIPTEAAADLLAMLREPAGDADPRCMGRAGGRARQSAEVIQRALHLVRRVLVDFGEDRVEREVAILWIERAIDAAEQALCPGDAEVRERVARPAYNDDDRQLVLGGVWG